LKIVDAVSLTEEIIFIIIIKCSIIFK
jgi:hypothetical protein